MAVMPLVPETKMADVGKLISLGKVAWLVLTTTSVTLQKKKTKKKQKKQLPKKKFEIATEEF